VWSVSNPGGRASVSGGFLVAEAKFIGLPSSNSDFGTKDVRVKLDGVVVTNTTIEVFFDKYARNSPVPSVPNWFYYWKDGAVCGIPPNAIYDASASFGYVLPQQDSILRLGPAAASANSGPEAFTGKTGQNIVVTGTGKGIKSVAETVEHELHHLTIYNTFNGTLDTDGDGIGDTGEATFDGLTTLVNDSDTFNMVLYSPGYKAYGDNEIRARLKELVQSVQIFPKKDWANPGAQSTNKFGP